MPFAKLCDLTVGLAELLDDRGRLLRGPVTNQILSNRRQPLRFPSFNYARDALTIFRELCCCGAAQPQIVIA